MRKVVMNVAAAVVGLSGVVGVAAAAPGDHLRAGNAVITPSLMAGTEFHTNVFRSDGDENALEPGLSLVVNPRLGVQVPGNSVQFDLDVGWGMKKFFDVTPNNGLNAERLDRYTEADASMGLLVLPRSVVGFRLDDVFGVDHYPAELGTAEDGDANVRIISNDLNGGFSIRPGSALDIGLLGNFGFDTYTLPTALESTSAASLNDRTAYGPLLDARWRFLPRTELLLGGNVNWLKWRNNIVDAVGGSTPGSEYGFYLGKPDALKWQATVGLKGQLTEKLAATLQLGYGQMYYDEATVEDAIGSLTAGADEFGGGESAAYAADLTSFAEGFVVNSQITWAPAKRQSVSIGYRKDFQDAFVSNYVTYNHVYLRYNGLYFDKLGLTAEASTRFDSYTGEISRVDQTFRMKANVAYKLTDWFSAGAGVGWTQLACVDQLCDSGQYYLAQYDDVYGSLGLTFSY